MQIFDRCLRCLHTLASADIRQMPEWTIGVEIVYTINCHRETLHPNETINRQMFQSLFVPVDSEQLVDIAISLVFPGVVNHSLNKMQRMLLNTFMYCMLLCSLTFSIYSSRIL